MKAQNFSLNPPGWTPPVDFNVPVPQAIKDTGHAAGFPTTVAPLVQNPGLGL